MRMWLPMMEDLCLNSLVAVDEKKMITFRFKVSAFHDKPLSWKVSWFSPLNLLVTPSDVEINGFLFIGFAPSFSCVVLRDLERNG